MTNLARHRQAAVLTIAGVAIVLVFFFLKTRFDFGASYPLLNLTNLLGLFLSQSLLGLYLTGAKFIKRFVFALSICFTANALAIVLEDYPYGSPSIWFAMAAFFALLACFLPQRAADNDLTHPHSELSFGDQTVVLSAVGEVPVGEILSVELSSSRDGSCMMNIEIEGYGVVTVGPSHRLPSQLAQLQQMNPGIVVRGQF